MWREKSEIEETNPTEKQTSGDLVEQKLWPSRWAKNSFSCGLFGWVFLLISPFTALIIVLITLSFILSIVGLISGVVSLIGIKYKHGAVEGTVKAVTGLLFSFLLVVAFIVLPYVITYPRFVACKIVCGQQLETLGKAMAIYSEVNNGKYPTASKWCDLLIEQTNVSGFLFVCKGAREERYHHTINQEDEPNSPWFQIFSYRDPNGQSYYVKRGYYAFNPNTEPNSPDDIVLLFETNGGWNQFGGPELLATGHHRKKGCNILFNDGHAEFVKSRDIEKLKWKAEESNSD